MPVHVEPKNLRDVLLYEAQNGYSRSVMALNVTVLGSVVNAAGDLIVPGGTAAEKKAVGVVVAKGTVVDAHAIVLQKGLVFPDGITDVQKAAALADLKAIGVKVR